MSKTTIWYCFASKFVALWAYLVLLNTMTDLKKNALEEAKFDFDLHPQMKEMAEAIMASYEEGVIANTTCLEIEHEIGIPMEDFGVLPNSVQFILIQQNRKIADYMVKMDDIREHLDNTPI